MLEHLKSLLCQETRYLNISRKDRFQASKYDIANSSGNTPSSSCQNRFASTVMTTTMSYSESSSPFSTSSEEDNFSFGGVNFDPMIFDVQRDPALVDYNRLPDSISSGGSISTGDEDDSMEVGIGDLLYALYPFQKPKRVRGIRRKLPVVPRLIQSDIRRNYSTMLLNALNSHDPLFIQPFVEKYLTPFVTLTKPAVKTAVMVKPSTFVEGADALVRYWSMLSIIIPDQILQAENVQVVRNSKDNSCRIVCDLISSCTQLYEHQLSARSLLSTSTTGSYAEINDSINDGHGRKKQRVDDGAIVAYNCPCEPVFCAIAGPPPAVAYGPLHLRLLPKPLKIQMIMKLTLHVNEMQQISSLEYGAASLVY